MMSPGAVLGRYELLYPAARGAMGEVWAARLVGAHGFERVVALKTILDGVSSVATRTLFIDEARTSALMRHDHIVPVIDFGEAEGRLFLVMEWVDGEPLSSFANIAVKDPVPVPLALKIGSDVLRGLHAAHSLVGKTREPLGVVHRDLTPSNVLVTDEGVAKIIDFGVAKSREHITTTAPDAALRGKLRFLSPEQVRGRKVSAATDLWQLALVLHQLVTGRHPLEGMDAATIGGLLHSNDELPIQLEASSPLHVFVRRALQKDPRERYASADEARKAIDAVARTMNLAATTDDLAAYMHWKFAKSMLLRSERTQKALAAPVARSLAPPNESPRASKSGEHPAIATPDLVLPRTSAAPARMSGAPPRTSSGPRTSRVPAASSKAPSARRPSPAPPVVPLVGIAQSGTTISDKPGRTLTLVVALLVSLMAAFLVYAAVRKSRAGQNDVPAPAPTPVEAPAPGQN